MEDSKAHKLKQIKDRLNRIKFYPRKSVINPLKTNNIKMPEGVSEFIADIPSKSKRLVYYLRIWFFMSKNSFMIMLSQKKIFVLFLTGKLLRFAFFGAFLYFLVLGAEDLAGYTVKQTIFFFLTFNVVDIMAQFLFREVYRFRQKVVSGDFDLILVKPFNSLFRVLMGGADVIDFVTIPPLMFAVWYVGKDLGPTFLQTVMYVSLLVNGFVIATAFHIGVLSLGIITLEVDHTVMIYRDMTNLGRLPVDIYKQPLRGVLTYLVPVGLMITIPAKALMGLAAPLSIFASFLVAGLLFFASLRFWDIALKSYASASS